MIESAMIPVTCGVGRVRLGWARIENDFRYGMRALSWQRQGFRLLQVVCVKRALLPAGNPSGWLPRKDRYLHGMRRLGDDGGASAESRGIICESIACRRWRRGRARTSLSYSVGVSAGGAVKTVISILAILDAARPCAPASTSPPAATMILARCPTASALRPGENPSLVCGFPAAVCFSGTCRC